MKTKETKAEHATVHIKIDEPNVLRKEILNLAISITAQLKKYQAIKKARIDKAQAISEAKRLFKEIKILAREIHISELPPDYAPAEKTEEPKRVKEEVSLAGIREYSSKTENLEEEIELLKRKIEQL